MKSKAYPAIIFTLILFTPLVLIPIFPVLSQGFQGVSEERLRLPTSITWDIQTVDSAGRVGMYTSIALDSAGNPHISYCYETNDFSAGNLKYAHWTGSEWHIQTVDSFGLVGWSTSLALDSTGNPHISYYDYTNGDLKYARWTGSEWHIQTVDSAGDVGRSTSLVLDSGGNPHIAYWHTTAGIKYARWTGSGWNIQTVTSGSQPSLKLDSAGNPHISYKSGYSLKYARWTGTGWVTQTVDEGYYWQQKGDFNSLALDNAGNPHISYCFARDYSNNCMLRYARWTGSFWTIRNVDDSPDSGRHTSLKLDGAGNPHIAYHNGFYKSLMYAYWTGSQWSIWTVDSGYVGYYASLALDSAGNPHISYYDCGGTTCIVSDLKYAKGRITTPTPTPISTPTTTPTPTPTATPSPTPTPGPMDKFVYLPLVLKDY